MSALVTAANPSHARRGTVKSRGYSKPRRNWRDFLRNLAMGYELDQDLHRDAISQRRDGDEYFLDKARYWLPASAPQWSIARPLRDQQEQGQQHEC
jgi:hypothetical protein